MFSKKNVFLRIFKICSTMTKQILGLDIGTNSIGWAVVRGQGDDAQPLQEIVAAGSRVIPVDAGVLGDFERGVSSKSKAAERTAFRQVRRMIERSHLRRQRLLRVLQVMDYLPPHYARCLDRYGKFLPHTEPKIAWNETADGHYEFLFRDAFDEMMAAFRQRNPEWVARGGKVPYDWTLYYLRTKALSQPVSPYELAWILLSFNQKRGYRQARGEQQEDDSRKLEEYKSLKVLSVEDTGEKKGDQTWYRVLLEDGSEYKRLSRNPLPWEGQVRDFIVTTTLDAQGKPKTEKDGRVKRTYRSPKADDWTLLKKKTEAQIAQAHQTVGAYIFEALLRNPSQKIRGKLVHTIDRKLYYDELKAILQAQQPYHVALTDPAVLERCVRTLYQKNEAHARQALCHDLTAFLLDDVLFYQRPLKSQKALIANCSFESLTYYDRQTGEEKQAPVKCIPKSHPLYAEYRLWQFLDNLRIYQLEGEVDGKKCFDIDVTRQFLPDHEAYARLFDWLYHRENVSWKDLPKYPPFGLTRTTAALYRWNYAQDKSYPCHETWAHMQQCLKKAGLSPDFLTPEREEALWHILYSVSDMQELGRALHTFAHKNGLTDDEAERFAKFFGKMEPFAHDYGACSAKALKKLLPLMRRGSYWSEEALAPGVRERIGQLLAGTDDAALPAKAREALKALHAVSDYQGLPLWLASYVVYNRHAEAKDIVRWETPADIDRFLLNFRPNELRNPIVELVVRETLRVVRDIWTRYGGFDEIHVELGREMKMPAKQRQKLSKRMLENERINLRIKMMLACFQNPEFKVDEVRPYSPYQQEILKIYEEYVLHDVKEIPDDITAIIKKFDKEEANEQPSVGEVLHYKEWLDKKYISPYTGEIIPLGRLLTHDYEIEHIIPQKRYFDDSLNNKVICESAVNNLKSAQLAHEFISQHHGEVVELGNGRTARILELEDYEKWVKEHYAALPRKRRNLLLDEVPEAFIARQLNDTRYISKYVSMLLSNIVRGEDERSVNSTHLIATNGSITTRLKQDWGINDVWNAIVLPRFERLNGMVPPKDGQPAQVYVTRNTQGHPIPTVPLDRQRGFSMKRIDHRHHAMDAIVIACASRNMVNYLNNESARKDAKVSRTDLQHLLCTKTRDDNGKYRWVVNKPWSTFTTDVRHALDDIVASFKQNRRIMSPTVNYFDHYDPATGKKRRKKQTQGKMQAVRMSMHDATFYGEINLRSIKAVSLKQALEQPQRIVNKDLKHKLQTLQAEGLNLKQMTAYFEEHHDEWADVNVKKIAVYVYSKEEGKARYFASRTVLDQSFTRKIIEHNVADTGIQQILLRHLVHYENAEQAFSPEGIEDMNKNLKELNNGRPHQPIYKVRTYTQGVKSAVGQRNCKAAQFVNGAKGTNLYFAVYEGTEGEVSESKRSFATFSLRDVLPCLKDGKPVIPEFDKKGKRLKFVLSPLDLVYVPTPEELKLGQVQLPLNKKRIYKMVSCSDARCFWVPVNVASAIVDKYEFSSKNKMERSVTEEMEIIKEICLPLDVDRLGNVHLRQ